MADALVAFRLPKELARDIDSLAVDEDRDRSALLREVIRLGMQEKLEAKAARLYSEGRVSLWKAASIAGVSLWTASEIMRERGIAAQYGPAELQEDLAALK